MTKVYTLQDFKVNKDKCKFHESGTWSVPIFGTELEFNINCSDILTELIHIAGRYCEHYASDLFIIWNSLESRLKDRNYTGEKLILGFREMGVDKNETVIKNFNGIGEYYYRKIAVLDIVINGNKIDIYMN